METRFQTSFIPKKPLVPEVGTKVREPVNILTLIGTVLFVLSIAGAVGVFAWEKLLVSQQKDYQSIIQHNREKFGNDIAFYERFNTKINLAKELLNNHLSTADIFDIVSKITTSNVRFTSFSATFPTNGKDLIRIVMKGEGTNFPTLAFQTDVFGQSKLIKDPIVSDFGANEQGKVGFGFSATVDPKLISFSSYIDKLFGTGETATTTTEVQTTTDIPGNLITTPPPGASNLTP